MIKGLIEKIEKSRLDSKEFVHDKASQKVGFDYAKRKIIRMIGEYFDNYKPLTFDYPNEEGLWYNGFMVYDICEIDGKFFKFADTDGRIEKSLHEIQKGKWIKINIPKGGVK